MFYNHLQEADSCWVNLVSHPDPLVQLFGISMPTTFRPSSLVKKVLLFTEWMYVIVMNLFHCITSWILQTMVPILANGFAAFFVIYSLISPQNGAAIYHPSLGAALFAAYQPHGGILGAIVNRFLPIFNRTVRHVAFFHNYVSNIFLLLVFDQYY